MRIKRSTILALPLLALASAAAVAMVRGSPAPQAPACAFLPADNPWNQRIDQAPVLARSHAYVKRLGLRKRVYGDFSVPWTSVSASQPKVPVSFFYSRESDHGRYPIPANAPIQRGTPDRHVLVLDRDACRLYELYKAQRIAGGKRWRAGAGAVFDLRSNRLRPRGWTSADAAGLPILPGLARYEEVERGEIDHALRFTAEGIRDSYVYPARHTDGRSRSRNAPPMGTRFRLKAGYDISGFPKQTQVIMVALKRYGLILADSGPAYSISGAPSRSWNFGDLESLKQIRGRDLEAVDTSALPKPH
jgi:hypothetical protein